MTPTIIRIVWFRGWDRAARTNFWDYVYEVHWPDGTTTTSYTIPPEWSGVEMMP